MSEDTKRIVEIGGVKVEVDLRDCKVIENYKVGDQVKVLMKNYSDYKSYPGVLIGFDDFKEHPSLLIAYLKSDYSGAEVEFLTFNSESKDIEICPLNKLDKFFSKADALEKLNKKITQKETELQELQQKKKYFESTFNKYFEEITV
jgi:hypothetical protein